MTSESLQKYEFKQSLERIRNYKGHATELVSLYIPPERKIYDVQSYLRNEASQSANIKSKSTRKNVSAAIESIMSRLKLYKAPPENGMVFFVGHVSKGGNQTTMVQEVVVPPEPIPSFLYRCDSGFFLEPLEGLGEVKSQFGLLVIDRSEAALGMLRGPTITTLKHMFSQVPSKHGKGGQSKRRFERLIEEAAHEWYKKVAHSATECFLDNEVEGILIGGPGATKDYFFSKDYLNHELKKVVIDTFDTGYTDETGLRELVTRGSGRLSEIQLVKEKVLMDRFMKEVLSPKGKLATYGLKQVEEALQMGATKKVLISEGLEKMPNMEEGLVKRLGELAERSKSEVIIISTDSEEGVALQKAFGGLAAMLRYPISLSLIHI